ncbi:MAG: hypothetical protein ACXACI_14560 [Candidatus Hodarchaeales archaeon]|jgi:hypothetical protein
MANIFLILGLCSRIFLLAVCFPSIVLLFRRYHQTRAPQILPLLIMVLTMVIFAINGILVLVATQQSVSEVFGPISVLLLLICYVAFAFWLTGLTRNSLFSGETGLVLFLVGLIAGLVGQKDQIQPIQEEDVSYFLFGNLLSILLGFLLIFTTIWGYRVLTKAREFAVNPKQDRQQQLIVFGLLGAFLGPLFVNVIGIVGYRMNSSMKQFAFFTLVTIPSLLIGLGIVVISIVYAWSKEAILLQPQQLYSLFVVNQDGLPLFTFQFVHRPPEEIADLALTAGVLNAIASILKETVGGGEDVREIITENRIIIAKRGTEFISILIAERASSFVHQALIRFTAAFDTEFGSHIQKFAGEIEIFKDATHLVRSMFGLG